MIDKHGSRLLFLGFFQILSFNEKKSGKIALSLIKTGVFLEFFSKIVLFRKNARKV